MYLRGVLAHSDVCRTEADVGLREKCGSVGRQKDIWEEWEVSKSASGTVVGSQTGL